MSDEQKQWWQTLPAVVGGAATLLTAITGLLIALNQMGVFAPKEKKPAPTPEIVEKPATGPVTPKKPEPQVTAKPEADRIPLGRTTFISDESDSVKPLATFLEKQGAEVSIISTERLEELATLRPDIVIVSSDTGTVWKKLSKTMLSRLFENSKVIASGAAGAALFQQLGLRLGDSQGMHSSGDRGATVVVPVPEFLRSPLTVPVENKTLQLYEASSSDTIGIYDEGSPTVAGFEGIARWAEQKNHWPICRQGNYVLWGFGAPASQMTDAGKRLFVNLFANHKARSAVPLSQSQKKPEYVKSGVISERLSKQFPNQSWTFQAQRPGRVRARLSWSPPETQLAFIIGTDQRRRFERKDGPSPLSLDLEVNDEDVAHSDDDWHVSVTHFGDFGTGAIDYKLELSLPQDSTSPPVPTITAPPQATPTGPPVTPRPASPTPRVIATPRPPARLSPSVFPLPLPPRVVVTPTPTPLPTKSKVDGFVGHWRSEDPNTVGLTKADIQAQSNRVTVHLWERCHPTDCDWGTKSVPLSEADDKGVLEIQWNGNKGYERTDLQIKIKVLPDKRLQITRHFHVIDAASSRPDYEKVGYFVR